MNAANSASSGPSHLAEYGLAALIALPLILGAVFFKDISRYFNRKEIEAQKIYQSLGIMTLKTVDPSYRKGR